MPGTSERVEASLFATYLYSPQHSHCQPPVFSERKNTTNQKARPSKGPPRSENEIDFDYRNFPFLLPTALRQLPTTPPGHARLCITADILRYAPNPSRFRVSHRISRPQPWHIPSSSAQTYMRAGKRATETSYKCPKDLKPETSSKKIYHREHIVH